MTEVNSSHSDNDRRPLELLAALLEECVRRAASDLHIVEGQRPWIRLQGPLQPMIDQATLTRESTIEIIKHLAPAYDCNAAGSKDGSFAASDGTRFRFNIYKRSGQLALALRRLEDRFRSLNELGLPESLYRLCDVPNGLVVISGATGAGKSTTLATLIDRINQTHHCHIITIEDPIEYVHHSACALVNQREVGRDTNGFNEALVASLRQDPDVILVGEIRDTDTIRTAITAAETGHLVFTTVHANDCVGTIERLVGVFPADEQTPIRQQLALVLRAIVSQRLLLADGSPVQAGDESALVRNRVVASEVLFATPAVANLILLGKASQIYSAIEAGGSWGMQTLEQDLARLWAAGVLSERSAIAAAKRGGLVKDHYVAITADMRPASPPLRYRSKGGSYR